MKLIGITGWKNSGKTGLVTRLVAHFSGAGLSVATVKHAHKGFDVDHPGRDSHRHREAGAAEVIVSSPVRVAHMTELRGAAEPSLDDLLARLGPVDLAVVEGFKRSPHPKIETFRAEAGHALMAPSDPTIQAVASDVAQPGLDRPVFDLDNTGEIAGFVATFLKL